MSDVTAGAMEDIFLGKNEDATRYKSLSNRASAAQKQYAMDQWNVLEGAIKYGGTKLDFSDKLKDSLHKFGDSFLGRLAENASNANSNLLSKEDMAFEKMHFIKAYSEWLAANGLNESDFEKATAEGNRQMLEKFAEGREYAVQTSLEMTYNSANRLAELLTKAERWPGVAGKAAQFLIEGTVPFKRTPANVVVQGIKYSPAGLVYGLYEAATHDNKAKAIQDVSAGMTGTALLMLGAWAAMAGLAKAGGDDSEREEYYDQMLGSQEYSFQIGDVNYTMDWATPASMPLFAGVQLVQYLKDMAANGELDDTDASRMGEAIFNGLAHMADPITNLSMLSSLNDALNSYSDNKLGAFVGNAAQSYALQFIPTLSGQVIRTMEDTRKSTYAPKDSTNPFGQKGEQMVNRVRNKSLIAHTLLGENEDYVDMWGRPEERSDNYAERVFEQFLSPGYIKRTNKTEVDDALAEVFAATNDAKVLPSTPKSYITIDGKKDYFSAAEYADYKRAVGTLSYQGVDSALQSELFNSFTAEEKAKVIAKIYDYAKEKAKYDYTEANDIPYEAETIIQKMDEANASGLSVGEYYLIQMGLSKCEGKKNDKGNTISGTLAKAKRNYLRSLGLSREQQDIFL